MDGIRSSLPPQSSREEGSPGTRTEEWLEGGRLAGEHLVEGSEAQVPVRRLRGLEEESRPEEAGVCRGELQVA